MSKILLTADKDDGVAGAEMKNLGDPLFLTVSLANKRFSMKKVCMFAWLPSLGRYQGNRESRRRNRSRSHGNLGMRGV